MVRYLSASFNCCVAGMDVETTSLPEIATPSKEEEESPDDRIAEVKTEAELEVQEVIATTEQSKVCIFHLLHHFYWCFHWSFSFDVFSDSFIFKLT